MQHLIKRYAKFAVAAVGAGAVALQAALTDNVITSAEWLAIAIAVATALGVITAPYAPARGDAGERTSR